MHKTPTKLVEAFSAIVNVTEIWIRESRYAQFPFKYNLYHSPRLHRVLKRKPLLRDRATYQFLPYPFFLLSLKKKTSTKLYIMTIHDEKKGYGKN